MFGSLWLEVAIGLVFVFFLVSLVSSAVVETFSRFTSRRARHLEAALTDMLTGGEPGPVAAGVDRVHDELRDLMEQVSSSTDKAAADVGDAAIGALNRISLAMNSPDRTGAVVSKDVLDALRVGAEQLERDTRNRAASLVDELASFFVVEAQALRYAPQQLLQASETYRALGRASKKMPGGVKFEKDARPRPSYVSATDFTEVVFDLLRSAKADLGDVASIDVDRLAGSLPAGLRARLDRILAQADVSLVEVRADLEMWFDSTMDRVGGAYRRWTQTVLFCVGLLAAIALNASAMNMAVAMYADDAVAEAVAGVAAANSTNANPSVDQIATQIDELQQLQLPFGWRLSEEGGDAGFADLNGFEDPMAGLSTIIGWFVTAALVMLGAPFWFDLLTRLVALRSSGAKPDKAVNDATSSTAQLAELRAAAGSGQDVDLLKAFGISALPLAGRTVATGRAEVIDLRQNSEPQLVTLTKLVSPTES